jgi:glycosyltransferase involved in cell wall biosynthesis
MLIVIPRYLFFFHFNDNFCFFGRERTIIYYYAMHRCLASVYNTLNIRIHSTICKNTRELRLCMVATRMNEPPETQEKGEVKTPLLPISSHIIFVPEGDIPPKGLVAVIPAYNEELVIGSVVLRTRQYVERVIVVDDGSLDRTAEVAKMAGAEVIRLDANTGKAYALLLGLRYAHNMGCTTAVMLDADGQHDPREIPRVAGLVIEGKADLVIGSRFLKKNNGIPKYRQLGQKTLDLFTNMGANSKVTDSQSGFRAISCKALENLDFKSDGYNVESDMINHFTKLGLIIQEVPISVKYDVPNKHKKNPVSHGVGVLTQLVNLIGYRRPLLLFGLPGVVFIIGGLAAEFWVFTVYYAAGGSFHYGIAIGSAFILITGMLLVVTGLILNTLLMIVKDQRL